MTVAEKSVCRAEKVARQIERNKKYEALVWKNWRKNISMTVMTFPTDGCHIST